MLSSDSDCHILFTVKNGAVIYKPLYLLSLALPVSSAPTEAERFLNENPNPNLLDHTADKLRWYRYEKKLLQREVADAIGVDRHTYIHYESRLHDYYPQDKLKLLAELFGIPLTSLLDGYNRFLQNGQGRQIKSMRESQDLSYREFAELLNTHVKTVIAWENETVFISKSNYEKLIKLF